MDTAVTATTSPASGNVSVADLAGMLKKSRATSNGAAAKGSTAAAGAAGTNGASTSGTPGTEANTGEDQTEVTTTADAGASAETTGSSSDPSPGRPPTEGGDGTNLEGEAETDDAEGEVDPEAESDDEGDEGEEAPGGDDLKSLKKNWRKARKRIGTLTRKLREAEALINAPAGPKGDGGPSPQPSPRGEGVENGARQEPRPPGIDGRFAHDARLVEAVKGLESANATLASAEDALEQLAQSGEETITLKENGKEFTFTRGDLRQIVRNARNAAGELTARKGHLTAAAEARWNAELNQANGEAAQAYPWVLKKGAAEWEDARAILGMMPGVADRPDRLLVVADFLEGRKARMARAAKAGAGTRPGTGGAPVLPGTGTAAAARPKPAVIPATGGAAVGANGRGDAVKAQVKQSEGNFRKSGRTEDLKELLKARKAAELVAG